MSGLENAYKKAKIRLQGGCGGTQLGWGFFATMYIGKDAIKEYLDGRSKDALVILAHEGSHYTYATRHGLLSGWWLQYEIEGYRISDILNIEFTGKNWKGGESVRSIEDIKKFLGTKSEYKWIPKFPFGFKYWNTEDIGQ